MQRYLVWALAAGGLLVGSGLRADEAKKPEGKSTWKIVSVIEDGKKVSNEHFKNFRLITEGDKYTLQMDGKTVGTGTVKIDTNKKPITIDRTAKTGPEEGKTYLGIMKIDGDTITVCWARPDKPRPKEFSSEKGSGHIVEVVKRVKD